MKEHGDIVVSKNESCLQRRIVEDGPMLAEIREVGKWIVQLLWHVEKKSLTFSRVRHIPSHVAMIGRPSLALYDLPPMNMATNITKGGGIRVTWLLVSPP
jgi:hypothetical protein